MSQERRSRPTGQEGAASTGCHDSGQHSRRGRQSTRYCPDCLGTAELIYARACPIGLGVDDLVATDAAWLHVDYPAAPGRWRTAEPAELAELTLAGVDTCGRIRVCVTRHPAGVQRSLFVDRRMMLVIVSETPPGGWGR
jgi:hypothetical protein